MCTCRKNDHFCSARHRKCRSRCASFLPFLASNLPCRPGFGKRRRVSKKSPFSSVFFRLRNPSWDLSRRRNRQALRQTHTTYPPPLVPTGSPTTARSLACLPCRRRRSCERRRRHGVAFNEKPEEEGVLSPPSSDPPPEGGSEKVGEIVWAPAV